MSVIDQFIDRNVQIEMLQAKVVALEKDFAIAVQSFIRIAAEREMQITELEADRDELRKECARLRAELLAYVESVAQSQ